MDLSVEGMPVVSAGRADRYLGVRACWVEGEPKPPAFPRDARPSGQAPVDGAATRKPCAVSRQSRKNWVNTCLSSGVGSPV